MGARDKLRDHFLSHVGKVLSHEELKVVSGNISEWARRVRELRDEEGFQIKSNNDDDTLKPGQYILVSATPLPKFERNISKGLRSFVLDRNGYTCQMCGAAAGEPHPVDPMRRTRLHIGHVMDKSHGGDDIESNLRAVCSVCNEGASNVTLDRPSRTKLISQVRRAGDDDQRHLLEWLIKKFGLG